MNKTSLLFYIAAVLFLLYHLITLSISPLIWTDEVFMASTAVDFMKNHTFRPTVDLGWTSGRQALVYGPMYFIFDSLFMGPLGVNVFTARLAGMLGGLVLLFVINQYLLKGNKTIFFILILCLFTDVYFLSSMHRGRNDTLSLLFYYSALFALLGSPLVNNNADFKIPRVVLSAVLYTFCILTTLRSGFISAPFVIIFLWYWWKHSFSLKAIRVPLIWGGVVIALYLPWVFWGFGGFNGMIAYYQLLKSNYPYFVTSWVRIPREMLPLFSLAFFATVTGLFIPAVRKNIWFVAAISIIVSYFKFVGDTGAPSRAGESAGFVPFSINDSGPYGVYIIPALYLLIILLAANLSTVNKYVKYVFVAGAGFLLLFNLGIFGLKNLLLASQAGTRNAGNVTAFVDAHIPHGDSIKVCGDEVYYYAVENNDNKFHMAISYGSDVEYIESFSRTTFDYDYLIISKRLERRNPKLVNQYLTNAKLEKVAEYSAPQSSFSKAITSKIGNSALEENYDGIIYKRIRN